MLGILLRRGSTAVGMSGLSMILENEESAFTLMTIGAAVILGSAIHDIATAGRAARQYNEAHGLTALDIYGFHKTETSPDQAVQVLETKITALKRRFGNG